MKTLVIYDSVFGNTEKIAQAIGAVLGVEALKVGAVQPEHLAGVELLVVGSPTRGFKATPALTSWLEGLVTNGLKGVRAAAFDTRIDSSTIGFFLARWMVRSNYAVKPMEKLLRLKGATIATTAAGFYVDASEGPLRAGELERAGEWAKTLA